MRVLGICGGNGVILYPFKGHLVANLEPRTAFKIQNDKQWRANFKDVPLFKSDADFTKAVVRGDISIEGIDLIIGAPDCGHSSMLSYSRKKSLSNPRDNSSLSSYLNGVKVIKPKLFVLENLPKFLEVITKEELRDFFDGYRLKFHEKSVWEWGNSQKNRKRLILIGVRRDILDEIPEIWPLIKEVYPVSEHKTCNELTKGLIYGKNGHIREDIHTKITLYAGYKVTAEEIQRGWLSTGWTRWQVTDRNFTTAPGIYRNLEEGFPNTARKANRQYNPEGLMMTPRELARIMGIPDEFKIYFEDSNVGYWINKGRTTVTKTCPMEIPVWLMEQLKKVEISLARMRV